jgi:hypothetical protein
MFGRGHHGPDEVALEQRVAGRSFDFSLTHPARSETAVVQQRERPRRSLTARWPAPCRVKAEVCEADVERSAAAFNSDA